MPAIKKERLDGDDMALTAFNASEYLAPLNASAIPVVTPHPPPYEHMFAHHRAYLGLHDPLQHQHLQHQDDLLLERFSSIPDFQPFFDGGEPCIEVECGENKALLYINKLCQGSKGPSIKYQGEWLTPNEFQFVSGRETAKDWKRSIRHKGKSLKTLMSKGILQVHPPICDCPGCRISSPVNRGRLAEKRTIPLPPNRVPKKELASIFSSDDSEGSERNTDHIKQEDELHYSIVRKSRDSDLSTIISNLHHTRQHGVPEAHPASEHSSAHSDDLLGKRRSFSPSSSECPSESKKSRSVSPKENPQSPEVEAGGSHVTPEEHYRQVMSALGDPGSYEEQQQRLFQLASSMGLPGYDVLRARQEALVAAAAARNPAAPEALVPSAGSSSSSQRRKQGLPQHRDAHFTDRDLSHPPPLLTPPHITLGPHLRPPFLGMPPTLCSTPGYSFLQPAQAEMLVRQQELLRKQSLARLEMSAELLRQKELENLHQRLLAADSVAALPANHPALRSLQDVPEGNLLRDELIRRSMLALRHGTSTPLLAQNQQHYPSSSPPKDHKAQTSDGRKAAEDPTGRRGRDKDEDRSSDSDAEVEERESSRSAREHKSPDRLSVPGSSTESPGRHLFPTGLGKPDLKYQLPPGLLPPLPALQAQLPFGFPYNTSPYFMGSVGGMFMDGESPEDISKWSVEDVCGFISSLAGCAEYTQVFRDQAVDGETLLLLTEEHLVTTMGLKLGPAVKILSQVARRVGRLFYMTGFPLTFPFPPTTLRPPDQEVSLLHRPESTSSGDDSPGQESSSAVLSRYESKTPS